MVRGIITESTCSSFCPLPWSSVQEHCCITLGQAQTCFGTHVWSSLPPLVQSAWQGQHPTSWSGIQPAPRSPPVSPPPGGWTPCPPSYKPRHAWSSCHWTWQVREWPAWAAAWATILVWMGLTWSPGRRSCTGGSHDTCAGLLWLWSYSGLSVIPDK